MTLGSFDFCGQFSNERWQVDFVKHCFKSGTTHANTNEFFVLFWQVAVVGFRNQCTLLQAVELGFLSQVALFEFFTLAGLCFGECFNISTFSFSFFFVAHLDSGSAGFGLGFKVS